MDQSVHSEDVQRYRRALTESSDGELLQVLLVLLQLVNDEEKDDRASSEQREPYLNKKSLGQAID